MIKMSNKTQLQTNNTNLDALITRVNAAKDVAASLPEASSGGSVETCTIQLTDNLGYNSIAFRCTTFDENGFSDFSESINPGLNSIENVVCGSHFFISEMSESGSITVSSNVTKTSMFLGANEYKINASAGEVVSIIVS